MINTIDPSYAQLELMALLIIALLAVLLWINKGNRSTMQKKLIEWFALVCAGVVVGVFVYMIYYLVGGGLD